MTIRNLAARQRMAKFFKEAAQYLWSGNGAYNDTSGCRYICLTFDCTNASAATRRACERLIDERLGSCASVEEWLMVNDHIPQTPLMTAALAVNSAPRFKPSEKRGS